MSLFRGFRASQAPVTLGFVIAIAAVFLISWLTQSDALLNLLKFDAASGASSPWTFLTYPFASGRDGNNLISIFFLCWWLIGIGSTVEHDMGSVRYGIFAATVTVLCALAFMVGGMVIGGNAALAGGWIPTVAVTVAWGTRYPNTIVQLFMVIPVPAKFVAWFSVALVFFSTNNAILALFSVVPMALVYLFAANKLPIPYNKSYSFTHRPTRTQRKREKEYFDDVKRREKQREEKERLRELFERSLIDDPDDEDGKKGRG